MTEQKPPRRRKPPKLLVTTKGAPWESFPPKRSEVAAVKALFAGTADAQAQLTAVNFIRDICGGTLLEFRPEGERASAFQSGKRFIWLELVKTSLLSAEYVKTLD